MNRVHHYQAPPHVPLSGDFRVRIRPVGGAWEEIPVFEVNVDMHQVRQASMAYFDMEGEVEVEICCLYTAIQSSELRPRSASLIPVVAQDTLTFALHEPRKLSIEINGDRFRNLHLFANPFELQPPKPDDPDVLFVKPGIHRTDDLLRLLSEPLDATGETPAVLYFGEGAHFVEETVLRLPSGITVYLAGGAALMGSLVCDRVQDVVIRGRGMIYLAMFHRFSAFRGVRVTFSSHIRIEGIMVIDPPHYSVFLGQSEQVEIENFKSFSTRGWSDGIDMMSCKQIQLRDLFMRNSDDCVAIYGSRWDYRGDTRDVTVRDSVLWADVAHALMIGTHGDHEQGGDIIENIRYENIDILEHHEPQVNYWGAMAINAGDGNTVRNVVYSHIRVDDFEMGQLFDIRVVHNKDYNPLPGNRIENVTFEQIEYNGTKGNPPRIHGYDEERAVEGITFNRMYINGRLLTSLEDSGFDTNSFARQIQFNTGEH
ncbi:Glycosyl hydrolases family 28 [compost metagenome]